ncbi:hypothetical protein CAN33_001030 [Aspergillus niger]|uniref:Uncharacterized protein n=2 Tax=Aspergillus TaxID=5052 RepID=A0A370PYK4_ASPPH|nr:hypothetical protein M752DRAFT_71925 [Aspergillus phoenicis ATCC 13157]TPR03617.1 hypothetical protein CAN33_001030 [Aspergillus niger]GJP87714.1 oxidoreductase, 2-nitropropane dioxygenase family [Aspergillus niger]
MRVLFPFGHLLRSFLLTSLIASIVTSAYLDAFLRGLHSNLFIRSIPGSLATAPQGAVGYYQPPPGPAVTYPYRVLTTSAPSNEETAATTVTGTSISTETKQESLQDGSNGINEPRKNIAIMSGTVTGTQVIMEATQSATANRDMTLTSGGFLLSILLGILHL